jgi:exopolysaccharide biosynthesis protein
MRKYIELFIGCLPLLIACGETEELPVFETPVAQTETGRKIIQSGIVAKVHSDESTSSVHGLTESSIDFLGMDGYLCKVFIYEIDLNVSGIHIAVCNANNSNSTTSFATQTLSEQAKAVDSESNRIRGAVNGGSFASNNSRPYGILVKNGVILKSSATVTGNNANPVFFAVTKTKQPMVADYEAIGTTVALTDLDNAVGGKARLIKNSAIVPLNSDTKTAKTVVATSAGNKVIFLVTDYGQYFNSNGLTGYNAAKILLSLGAENALLLNEGNFTTFISRNNDGLFLKNQPPNNGQEAKINHGLIIVQN